MFRKKAFIIGAGASAEFDLPTGSQLVSKIQKLCDIQVDEFGRPTSASLPMWRAFTFLFRENPDIWNAKRFVQLANTVQRNMGLAPSIDNFLDSKRHELDCAQLGKLAIAHAVLQEERRSKLWFDRNHVNKFPSFAQFPSNWLNELFRVLVARNTLEEFCEALASCRFITFNYDRVIEQFFHQAVRSYYDLMPSEVDELCDKHLNIIHVYGCLGDVTCTKVSGYGDIENYGYLLEASRRIKTFTEGVGDRSQILQARDWIEDSEITLFLGFGFLPLNLRILGPEPGRRYSSRRIIGTSKGMSESNLEIEKNLIRHEWYGGFQDEFGFDDVASHELIWKNWMYLAEADRA